MGPTVYSLERAVEAVGPIFLVLENAMEELETSVDEVETAVEAVAGVGAAAAGVGGDPTLSPPATL